MSRRLSKTLCEVVSISKERLDPNDHADEEFFYLGLEDIQSHTGELLKSTLTRGRDILSTKNIFHANQILYGKLRPYLNKVHLAQRDGICSTDIYVLICNPEAILPDYVAYYLRSSAVVRRLTELVGGAHLPRVNEKNLLGLPIELPPFSEQERIVGILNEADQLWRLRTEADRRTKDLIPALFHEMFGDATANPRHYPRFRIGDITKLVTSGLTPLGGAENYIADGPYFFRSQNIQMNQIDFEDIACLPVEIHESMGRTKVHEGDVLLNITGASIGRVAWVEKLDREANVNQHVCIIRPNQELILPPFLSVFLSTPYGQEVINQIQAGASRQGLNHEQVRSIMVLVPPISEQRTFVARINEIQLWREEQANSRRRVEDLFQSLLQQAFQGEL
jgi:type I restriction enzyme S subunit